MRTKYMIIYLAVGVAFLAVSLWAFLSNGKSARAIRYKYKLGGIMLTAWAMLSAASCTGPGPVVTCYEPAVTCYDAVMENNQVSVEVKEYGGQKLKSGDVLVIRIDYPTFGKFRCRITADPDNGDAFVIQSQDFEFLTGEAVFEMTLVPTDYKGNTKVTVCGLNITGDGTEEEVPVGTAIVTIF